MSNIIATVSNIECCDNLHIVNFAFNNVTLSMMSLELNKQIKIGTQVKLNIKSAQIAIAKNFSGDVSYSNQLECKIKDMENGKLLSSIKLQIGTLYLESIITVNSSKRMGLKVGDDVTAFIKASDLSILEVINA